MSARRGQRVRFPSAEQMLATPPPVPQVGPVVFSLLFGGQLHTVDLSDLPCPRLTRRLAQALVGLGGDDNTMRYLDGFKQTVAQVRRFVCFVAEVQSADADADDFDVPHLAPDLLAAYEQRLLARHGTTSTEPHRGMAKLVRLLRKVYDNDPGSFEPALQARIGYASTSAETTIGTPLDAYPSRVFEEIAAQAAEDVRKILNRIQDGEHGAALGTDPRTARGGWGKLNNALWYVDHHGPLTGREQKIWGVQCLGGIRAVNAHLFLTSADLVPLHALLICQTGLEPESVKQLTANCLVNPARGFVSISYVKNRSHGQSHKTLRVADGGALHHPGGLIRLALRLTQRGRALTGSEALWVQVTATGHPEDAFDRRRDLSTRTRDWVAASPRLSGLKDQDGRPLRVDLRRLRKTFKSVRYQQAAGILSDFTAGHTQGVAARHYADIAAHRDVHEQAVEAGLEEAMNAALPPPVVLDEDGQRLDEGTATLAPADVSAALAEHNDVFLASCRNFFASPFAKTEGAACPVPIWGCLECSNAVYTTRHLPSVLLFLDFIETQREQFSTTEWQSRYGLAWQRIVTGIRPKFSASQITMARAIAEGAGTRLALPAQFLAGIA